MADDNNNKKQSNYKNPEVWDNIPIDYEQVMSMGEASARGLEVDGMLDYLMSKKKNPNVKKYSIVMDNGGHKLYYFGVDPKFEEAFFKEFEEGGIYNEISGGRKPFLIEDKKKSTKNLLENVLNKNKTNFLPEISTVDHLKKEIDFAKKNNDAALVDNLYTHMINLGGEFKNIKSNFTLEPWQKKYHNYLNEQFRIAEEEKVSDAASKSTITTVDGGGGGNAIIIEDPTNEKQKDIVFTRTPGY